jgi:AcrR family transcriptional regulator
MEKHYGEIVEYYVRKKGVSITELAAGLNVNRRSVYNYFQNKYLKIDIIFNIGVLIRHDFSSEFPELFTSEEFDRKTMQNVNNDLVVDPNSDEEKWKDKYIQLLEVYNETLGMQITDKASGNQQS